MDAILEGLQEEGVGGPTPGDLWRSIASRDERDIFVNNLPGTSSLEVLGLALSMSLCILLCE
jgi:hypothetical protein